MIMVITLLLLAIAIYVAKNIDDEFKRACAVFLAIFLAIVLLGMNIYAIVAKVTADATLASNQARYESLMYQAENIKYDNDNDLGKKELANEIREWNEDLAEGRALQNNKMIGVFYPQIYDKLEFIPLDVLR